MTQRIEHFEARFTGVVELDPAAIHAIELDGLAMLVVAVNVQELGATRLAKKDAQPRRKDVYKVTDARLLLGNARTAGIEYLAGGTFELPPEDTEAQVAEDAPVLGRLEPVYEPPEEVEVAPVSEGVQVVGSISDYRSERLSTPPSSGRSGPKVARFRPEDADDVGGAVSGAERVGSIYRGARKDKVLDDYMNASE